MQPLPPQTSGRNRPASVGGVPLTWDANGNLASKGDRHFEYDFRNRLTRVADALGTEIATYAYDALNRRVEKSFPDGSSLTTAWSGWQSVEEKIGGQNRGVRVYGPGIDELVLSETDLSGDGQFETRYQPLYDSLGSLVALSGTQGQLVGAAQHSAFGVDSVWRVDSTPPDVEHVRIEGGSILIETSEELAGESLGQAESSGGVRLVINVAGGSSLAPGSGGSNLSAATTTPVALSFDRPVGLGRNARRRLVLTPETPPSPGDSVTVTLEPSALRDLFLNQAASQYTLTFTWPESSPDPIVLDDTTAPEINLVAIRQGHLVVELTETPDLSTVASAILVDGQPLTWTLDEDGYTLRSVELLTTDATALTIATTLTDLAGNGLLQALNINLASVLSAPSRQSGAAVFTSLADGSQMPPDAELRERPDPDQVAVESLGNLFGYHGRPVDPETGLVYFRNRYYDPELARFITADPLGYVDGPSQYVFAMNSPVVFGDPLGLLVGVPEAPALLTDAALARLRLALDSRQNFWTRLEAANQTVNFGSLAVGEQGALAFVNFPARADHATDAASQDFVAALSDEASSLERAKRISRGSGTLLLSLADGLSLGLPAASASESTVLRWVGRANQRWNPLRWFDSLGDAASLGFREGAIEGVETLAPRVRVPRGTPNLSGRGFRPPPGTRLVPEGIPEGWRIRPTRGEGGARYFDPQNPGNAVRVMPGNPNSPYPNSRAPYVRWQRNGQALDVNGNVVPRNSPEAHIPLEDFRFDPALFQ